MTGIEVAIPAKANKLWAICKIAKKLQIREKYEAELAVLNAKDSFSLPRSLSLF